MRRFISDYCAAATRTAREKGWYDKPATDVERLCLMHSELSEALEEIRNNHDVKEVYFSPEGGKPEGVPIELADCVIRIFDFCGYHGIDLEKAIELKMGYNKTRPVRHGNKAL